MEVRHTWQDYTCDFCDKKNMDTYILIPTTDTEYDILAKDFGTKFEDSPIIKVCEECLQGYCGKNPELTPTKWFEAIYNTLPKNVKKMN